MHDQEAAADPARTRLLPVLPIEDLCLFPGASLTVYVDHPDELLASEIAERTGGHLLALGRRGHAPRDLQSVGTVAQIRSCGGAEGGAHPVELQGVSRAKVRVVVHAPVLVAEVVDLEEGEVGDDSWGPAVEALARYLHVHPELRDFLERQRRSGDPMAWVSLACQHLPITASARQKLLESDARERCRKICRGMDALLRKEKRNGGPLTI
jgi:ATP-dependent Lon protease